MANIKVIAKAYDSEPLERLAVGKGPSVVYLSVLSVSGANGIRQNDSVGFPVESVLEHDSASLVQSRDAYDTGDSRLLERLWREARPIGS